MNYWRRRPSMKPENIKRRMANRMARVVAALVIAGAAYVWNTYFASAGPTTEAVPEERQTATTASRDNADENAAVERLIATQGTGLQVTAHAVVARLLPDDDNGSPHQKFLIELPSGHRLLVAHNIDIAPRVDDLQVGDPIVVHGEFVWNDRGGVMHWTHRDPAGRHQAGWIEYHDRKYQ